MTNRKKIKCYLKWFKVPHCGIGLVSLDLEKLWPDDCGLNTPRQCGIQLIYFHKR